MYLSTISSRLLMYDTSSWDIKKTYSCYDGIDGVMRDISWSDDGKYMLQVNSKGLIEVLTAADHDIRSLQHIPLKDTWSASFQREGHRNIAIGTNSGNVLIWDTKNKTITKTFPTPAQQSSVNLISYNSKNTSLAASMQNGNTIIYGLVSNIPVLTFKVSCSKSISAMKFHYESRSLLGLACDEGHVVLRDITTNKDKVLFQNVHASPVSDIAFSLINKDVMLSSGYDKMMHIYDIRLEGVVSTVHTSYCLTSLAINTQNQVALGTKSGIVLIYDLRDLSTPHKILTNHEEEVRKVAFQPTRKEASNDVSLREDTETNLSPIKINSPVRNRVPDIFVISATPPKLNLALPPQCETKDDSFLDRLGLDNSNVSKMSMEDEEKSFRNDSMYHHVDIAKNKSNSMSTPLKTTNRTTDGLSFLSPICAANVVPDDGQVRNGNLSKSNATIQKIFLEGTTVEEFKDFMKLTVLDLADSNTNYYLDVMMALTKQKLYLEKQLSVINGNIHTLIQNQNALIEINRQMLLQIEQSKAQTNSSGT